jgi:hypothetical protein
VSWIETAEMAVLWSGGEAFPEWAVADGDDGLVEDGSDEFEPEPLDCSIRDLERSQGVMDVVT